MVIKRTIDKETVKDLPKAAFPGQIHVVQTPWEAEKAVAYLKSCPLLGIDSGSIFKEVSTNAERFTPSACSRNLQNSAATVTNSTAFRSNIT